MTTEVSAQGFACAGCGARVEYAPGTSVLRCPYCGHEQPVPQATRAVREHAIAELAPLVGKPAASAAYVFTCARCGAQTTSDALSLQCQFCGAPLVRQDAVPDQVAPEAVLPFAVDRNGVRTALRGWVRSRWFAPGSLKKVSEAESLKGTYLPHWTFDAGTRSDYTGQRGVHYYTTETYTDSQGRTQTRQVQHTMWHPASGTVARDFDDILVVGTDRVSPEHLEKLEPWPLPEARPYQPDFLAGYNTLRYDVGPEAGLEVAKGRMDKVIAGDCKRDIGGDEQRLNSVDTTYFNVMFKLLLLPVWIAVYLHRGRSYQVLVNARTAEVIGQRPYSPAKIAAAIVAAVAVVALIIVAVVLSRH
jgi:DNA-directed RNA polymerase subunit RPC12/RpoP